MKLNQSDFQLKSSFDQNCTWYRFSIKTATQFIIWSKVKCQFQQKWNVNFIKSDNLIVAETIVRLDHFLHRAYIFYLDKIQRNSIDCLKCNLDNKQIKKESLIF